MKTTLNLLFHVSMLAVIILVSGCSNSSSPGSSVTTIVIPAKGSWFITVSTGKDSTGQVIYSDTLTETIIATGLTVDNKTDVLEFTSQSHGLGPDTSYGHYESNGDVSRRPIHGGLHSYIAPTGWFVLPVGSQSSTSFDTTEGATDNTSTLAGAGSGSFTIKGKTFSTEKASLITVLKYPARPGVKDTVIFDIISFAPGIPWTTTEDDQATRDPYSGALGTSVHKELVDYNLY